MPAASRYTPEIVQEIFVRLAEGETIAAICAIDRMPALSTFGAWRRTRRDFDQNVTALLAQRKFRWPVRRRPSLCTPELTARIAGQLETGRTLYAICRDDPGLPTYACVHRWLKTRPDFARAVAAAMPWTRPHRTPRGRPSDWSETLARTLCARIAAGEPLLRVCEEPGMPCRRTVQRWLRNQPRFRGLYAAARVVEYELLLDKGLDLVLDAPPGGAREAAAAFKCVRIRVAAMDRHIARWRQDALWD